MKNTKSKNVSVGAQCNRAACTLAQSHHQVPGGPRVCPPTGFEDLTQLCEECKHNPTEGTETEAHVALENSATRSSQQQTGRAQVLACSLPQRWKPSSLPTSPNRDLTPAGLQSSDKRDPNPSRTVT